MSKEIVQIFQETYRELRPVADVPEITVQFFAFANLNNTVRLREGKLRVRLSDLLEGAPEAVLRSIAHILLAKVYRKPLDRAQVLRYRKYAAGHHVARKIHLVRKLRGRKHIASARGQYYDLEAIFDFLNTNYFHGLLGRPNMTWSRDHARNALGHYDPAHNAIVVSRIFDDPQVPRYAVEYIVYHEMLHLKHPVKLRGTRRCVHPPEFVAEENLFPRLEAAKRFIQRM
jgi:predicted metal-dependent hydrolase